MPPILEGAQHAISGIRHGHRCIAARLKKAGLKPLGDDGTSFQRYTMREARVDTNGAYIEVEGRKFPFGDAILLRSFRRASRRSLPAHIYMGHGLGGDLAGNVFLFLSLGGGGGGGGGDVMYTLVRFRIAAMGAVRVPASQLDLSGGASPDNTDHLVSFRELLFADDAQEGVNMGALQDILVPGPPDPVTGQPTLVPVPVAPSISGGGALSLRGVLQPVRRSGITHADWLTTAELKLIAEWLDIGGQYSNDPFLAPGQVRR